MFDLSKIFNLSKKFAPPDTLLKSKNYCTDISEKNQSKFLGKFEIWIIKRRRLGINSVIPSTRCWSTYRISTDSCLFFVFFPPLNSLHCKNSIYEDENCYFTQFQLKKNQLSLLYFAKKNTVDRRPGQKCFDHDINQSCKSSALGRS